MQHEKWSCPKCDEKNYELGEKESQVVSGQEFLTSKIKNTVLSHVKSVPTLSFTKVSPRLPW